MGIGDSRNGVEIYQLFRGESSSSIVGNAVANSRQIARVCLTSSCNNPSDQV